MSTHTYGNGFIQDNDMWRLAVRSGDIEGCFLLSYEEYEDKAWVRKSELSLEIDAEMAMKIHELITCLTALEGE